MFVEILCPRPSAVPSHRCPFPRRHSLGPSKAEWLGTPPLPCHPPHGGGLGAAGGAAGAVPRGPWDSRSPAAAAGPGVPGGGPVLVPVAGWVSPGALPGAAAARPCPELRPPAGLRAWGWGRARVPRRAAPQRGLLWECLGGRVRVRGPGHAGSCAPSLSPVKQRH